MAIATVKSWCVVNMLDLPRDAPERTRVVSEHLQHRWVAQLCRAGDRVVEVALDGSKLLPLLTRECLELHSLTVLGDLGPSVGSSSLLAVDGRTFAVTHRPWDGCRPWPIAGPADLIVDVGAAWAPTGTGGARASCARRST